MLSGETTLPLDLDMTSPCSSSTMPWHSRLVKGSSKLNMSMSRKTLVKKREYSRCKIACSMPPMYWSTGMKLSTLSLAKGFSALWGSV